MRLSKVASFFGKAAHAIAKSAGEAEREIAKIKGIEPDIEGLTSVVFPGVAPIEAAAFGVLGLVAEAIHETGSAAAHGGMNLSLDKDAVTTLAQLTHRIEEAVKRAGAVPPKA